MSKQSPQTTIWNARQALNYALSEAENAVIRQPDGGPVLRALAGRAGLLAQKFDAYVAALLSAASSEAEWDTHASYGAERLADELRIEAAKADADEAERAANPPVWSHKREAFV